MADVMESVRLLIDIPKSVYEDFINNCYTRNDMIAIHNSIMHAQAENKVFLETLSKRCNELVASGELPIEYMEDWFKKELGLPCSRSEIFEEIRRKLDENN